MKTILYTLTLVIGILMSNQLSANSIPADTVSYKGKKYMNFNSTRETDVIAKHSFLNTSLAPISKGLVKNNKSNDGHQAYYLTDENIDNTITNINTAHKQVLYKSSNVLNQNWNDTIKDEIVQKVYEQNDSSKK